MTVKLTKTKIDSAKYEGNGDSKCIFWDSEITGLGLRVYPSGKKSFVLSYRQNKRKRLFVMAQYGVLTLEEARKEAKSLLGDIIKGEDPVQNRQNKNNAKIISELCEVYIEKHAKPHKKSWKEDERRINHHILPTWGNQTIESITRQDVATLHQKIGAKTIYEANRVLALLSKMFDLAIEWGLLPETHANPALRAKKFKEEKRDRWVHQDEMPRLMKAINKEENIYARYAILMYLLTAMRRMELLTLQWKEINWEREEIRLGDTKSGRIHYVPISTVARTILQQIPKEHDNPYVFVGKGGKSHLVNISKPWLRIREEANLPDVRLHDLRRTVGSWMAQSGHSLPLIGKVLNHSNQSTTAIYARLQDDSARQALEEHGAAMKVYLND